MITEGLKGRDFITLRDFTKEEIDTMLDVALTLKLYRIAAWSGGVRDPRNGEHLAVSVPR